MSDADSGVFLKRLWTVVAVALIPVFTWIYWVAEEGGGLRDVVAIDHALVAGSIVEGQGMSSKVITPLHVRLEDGIGKADPVFARPALALWEALWFQLAGDSADTVIASSGIFFVFAAWMVFLLASRFHSTLTAWVCFLVFVFNPAVLDLAASGRPEPMGMFLVCLLFLLLSNDPPGHEASLIPWRGCLWSGVVAGLLYQCVPYLTLPLCLMLPVYWFRWPFRLALDQTAYAASTASGAPLMAGKWPIARLAMILPALCLFGGLIPGLLVYLGRFLVDGPAPVSVDRFLLTVDTSVALGWSYWREYATMEPSALQFFSMHTASIFLKWMAGMSYGFNSVFDVFQPVVFAMFVLALFFPEHGERYGYRWLLLFLVSLQIAGMAPFYWDVRFLAVWSPMIIVTGIGTFSEFLQQRYLTRQRNETAVERPYLQHLKEEFVLYYLPLMLLLVLTSGLMFLRTWDRTPPDELSTTAAMETMLEDPGKYEYIVTPAPWMVAWHTGMRAVWMPEYESAMQLMEEHYGDLLKTVYLPRNTAEILHDQAPIWWFFALRQHKQLENYAMAEFSGFGEAVYLRKTPGKEK